MLKHAFLSLVAIAIGCAGYFLGAIRDRPIHMLSADSAVPLEYYTSAKSFSEIENTRAVLEGLALRYVEQARVLIAQELMHQPAQPNNGNFNPDRPRLQAIRMLEAGLSEFDGTDHGIRLVQTLLFALKREGFHHRWVDVYLGVLYRYPTHELVANMAQDALLIGQATGRAHEIAHALDHVRRIPAGFQLAPAFEPALVRASTGNRTIDSSPDHVL
jgi:hypothetical protein